MKYLLLFLMVGCTQAGFEVVPRQGGLFVCQQVAPLKVPNDLYYCDTRDECNKYCEKLRGANQ